MAEPEILNVPPVEAIEHFRRKGKHVGFDWRDTDAATHAVSFTVAKAMRVDLLEDIERAVDRSLAKGETFDAFRQSLEPILRTKGWWGRQKMTDPLTGEERIVQLGSVHRLRTIFDTNLRTSVARGRWERIERLKERMPLLRYVGVMDARTRPEHARWHGTVLPVDHPWWKTHYPPNGWYCRCVVQQLSEEDVEEFGYQVSSGPPTGSGRTRAWTNKRTGETVQVPVGIDPGFAHNVGTVRPVAQSVKALEEKVEAARAPIAAAAKKRELDDWIVEGRIERERLVEDAGGVDAPDFPARFREGLRDRLRQERGAGTVAAVIDAERGGGRRAQRVRDAAKELPASWVRAGNALPVTGMRGNNRGVYRTGRDRATGEVVGAISVSKDVGNPLHEYCHHLQRAMPGLDRLFGALHRRRTKGEPRVVVGAPGELGREDQYVDKYSGREYGAAEEPREVFTVAVQQTFHPVWGTEYLGEMARDDPEMLDLVIGVLLRYDP